MAVVFCKQRFDFVRKTAIEKLEKYSKNPEHRKKYVSLYLCIENAVLREKYFEKNETEKLNNLLITDYGKVKNKEQNGGNHTKAMTATLFRHLNEQGYKFSMITTGISSHVRYFLEEKGVRLLSLRLLLSEDLKTSVRWSGFFFYLRSKRNRKFKHLVQTKPMGENTITNIMKVSVVGTTLKESEKKVYES